MVETELESHVHNRSPTVVTLENLGILGGKWGCRELAGGREMGADVEK